MSIIVFEFSSASEHVLIEVRPHPGRHIWTDSDDGPDIVIDTWETDPPPALIGPAEVTLDDEDALQKIAR